ncbi:MAG: PilZ domain-containing protein [Thermodesulfobacteriota bacterium]|nr:PilZ domain-containing protein [Thermodesulfobacteriota bacterium]
MVQGVKKRRARRFEIPGGKVRYKKTGLLVLFKGFSTAYPVVNVSKGGLALVCEEKLDQGKKVMVQLLAPNEKPLNLHARLRWRGSTDSGDMLLGVEFMPFTGRRGHNSFEELDVLRRLDVQHGKE